MFAKFDQFLPVRSHFDTKRPVNFFHIATFYPTAGVKNNSCLNTFLPITPKIVIVGETGHAFCNCDLHGV